METKIRLQKFFTDAGVLSRRACEAEILAGNVTVNGARAELGMKIDPKADTVRWKGIEIRFTNGLTSRTYIMLNKPIGYVTTLSDEKGRQSVANLIADVGTRVYPIGRLDMYSDGLLLCTNDGELANKLMHPSHDIAKTYIVTVKGHLSEAEAARLTEPMELDGYKLRPVEILLLAASETMPDGTPASQIEIILHEGRNRQIRRMCDAVGMKILRLRRVAEGKITLGNLTAGKWRHLTAEEVAYLKSI